MEWQSELVKAISEDFANRKEKKPGFSLRSYAQKLGLSSGALSDLLHQRENWRISAERASQIVEKLPLKVAFRNKLLLRMGFQPRHEKQNLAEANYDILTDWTYYPVLFSFDLPIEFRTLENIAQRIGISKDKVASVIDDLIVRKLLVRSEQGVVQRPEVFLSTQDNPPTPKEVIFRHHEINLQMAQKALREQSSERRDFTSLTFAGSQKQIEFLRQEIRKVYEKASSLATLENEPDTVYRLSVQLFPMEFKNND